MSGCHRLIVIGLLIASCAHAQDHADHSQHAGHAPANPLASSRHVPPDPPQHVMHDMTAAEMIELMDMDDSAAFFMLRGNELEWRRGQDDSALSWDIDAWYGGDYNKLLIKSEGETGGEATQTHSELLWDRIISRWWTVQAGVRHDEFEASPRTWAAFGIQGLAPYWFEVEAMAYLGQEGRSALHLAVEYELLITQRLILQPQLEINLFGTDDPENGIGAGLSNSELSLRLRYEIERELAPYVGVAWTRLYGATADFSKNAGVNASDIAWIAGFRWWF